MRVTDGLGDTNKDLPLGNRQNIVVTLPAGSAVPLVSREPTVNPKLYFLGPKP